MWQIKRILVPTDFSEHSRLALGYAKDHAERHGAELLLCHVMEPPVYPTMLEGTALVMPPLDEKVRDQVERQLVELRDASIGPDLPCRVVLREGTPTTEIIELAKTEDVDLIIIATHGYTGLKHILLGSTTEKVVRLAPCPVLTVRSKHAGTTDA
jgi:nucleotide-binding universal stress UspA family protein